MVGAPGAGGGGCASVGDLAVLGVSLFGFPIAAGIPAEKVAAFTVGLRPEDYVDIDWRLLASLSPRRRGFAGIVKGERIEETYRRLLGDMSLGDMPIPAYAPIWNIEENRVEYIGPRLIPTFRWPVPSAWRSPFRCSSSRCGSTAATGATAASSTSSRCGRFSTSRSHRDVALAINGFYPPRFAGEDATGWQDRRGSILYVASQVRTCQQVELARTNLARLEDEARCS